MTSAKISAIIIMADYGHDPTETTAPYTAFVNAGFEVHFATENGKQPACDTLLLQGLTQKVLGATQEIVSQYNIMTTSPAFQKPKAWTAPDFSLDEYDLVFFPGGHDKAMRQILDSTALQPHIAKVFPRTLRTSGDKKTIGAICHGVQVVSNAKYTSGEHSGKSVLHDVTTTALPAWMERFAYYGTKVWLGDYYKTYGAGSDNVETFVCEMLDDKGKNQYKNPWTLLPFVVEDEKYNFFSGRWPGDAHLIGEMIVQRAKECHGLV